VPLPGNPQALNRYAYGLNNPVKYNDPTGHYAFEEGPGDYWIYSNGQIRSQYWYTHPESGTSSPVSDRELLVTMTSPFWAAAAVVAGGGAVEAGVSTLVAAAPAVKTAIWGLLGLANADGDPTNEVRTIGNAISAESSKVAQKGIGWTGKIGEDALAEFGGEARAFQPTDYGARFVDRLAEGIAHEAKVGYTSRTQRIRWQIAKDQFLLNTMRVKGVTGTSSPVR
jgi:hypothetical protein